MKKVFPEKEHELSSSNWWELLVKLPCKHWVCAFVAKERGKDNRACGRQNSQLFSSLTQSCPTLWDPMNCSTPGLPVHHQLPNFTQTHAHRVGDAIQPFHPLLSPSPPAHNPSQHQGLFQWVNSLNEVAKVLEFQLQHQSFQWTPRTDLLQDGLVGSPCSPRDSQESSPTPVQKHQFFGAQVSSWSNSHIHTWPLEKP